ncbi:hypothetical protein IVB12_31545 [Bradyrhizobium sp. 179]|uniref:hypothetical protein n=1 Tax=Bradyrhizobium sp. 179 TaxID=2782648 RepID=UPI001FFABF6C|nr:hypothetical protein [Bradyrhizobium sp. 179]MCK1546353.1 hypothetical protein [Bradyrhizobium sp. 179]
MLKTPHPMPLVDFINETIEVLHQQPTPHEIKVKRLGVLRDAEAEGRFEQTFNMLNGTH